MGEILLKDYAEKNNISFYNLSHYIYYKYELIKLTKRVKIVIDCMSKYGKPFQRQSKAIMILDEQLFGEKYNYLINHKERAINI